MCVAGRATRVGGPRLTNRFLGYARAVELALGQNVRPGWAIHQYQRLDHEGEDYLAVLK